MSNKKLGQLLQAAKKAVNISKGVLKVPRPKNSKYAKISPIQVERKADKYTRYERRKRAKERKGKTFAPKNTVVVDKAIPFDPAATVQSYIDGVMNGSIIVGRWVRMCVERHLDDMKHAHERGYSFSPEKGAEAIWFFATCLRFTKGEMATKPFLQYEDIAAGNYKYGECSNFIPSPNQAFILWCMYGWCHAETGYRRFSTVYITAARKWGKSEFGAGIAIKQGALDNPPEPGARVLIAATKKEQAFELTWKQASQMVETSPALRELIDVYQYALVTGNRPPQPFSTIKAIGSNSKTSDGFDGSCIVMDELHAWEGKKHGDFYDKLVTATGSRRQPLTLMITTAGNEQSTIWIAKDTLYCNVLESAVKQKIHVADHIFAFIARLDEARECDCRGENQECQFCKGTGTIPEDDLYDEANWPKANPNYPCTPTVKGLREDASVSKMDSLQKNSWKQYHCNMKSSSAAKFISTALWGACSVPALSDWKTAEVITGAIDVGTRDDLASCGLCAKFRMPKEQVQEVLERMLRFITGEKLSDSTKQALRNKAVDQYRYEVKSYSWTPLNPLRNLKKEPWASWVATGQLNVMEQAAIDIEEMQNKIITLGKENKVKAFRGDPHNATQLLQNLEKAGFEVVEHQQTYAMYNEPLQEFLRLVRLCVITYNGQTSSLLSWAVNNTVVRKNNLRNEWILDKEKSPEKIDPVTAMVMSFAEAMYTPPKGSSQPYSSNKGSGIFG